LIYHITKQTFYWVILHFDWLPDGGLTHSLKMVVLDIMKNTTLIWRCCKFNTFISHWYSSLNIWTIVWRKKLLTKLKLKLNHSQREQMQIRKWWRHFNLAMFCTHQNILIINFTLFNIIFANCSSQLCVPSLVTEACKRKNWIISCQTNTNNKH